jgi:hypothetical protein
MFSETRYELNGDLRVAYRTSHEGQRDIAFVSPPFTNCEVFPELPYIQGRFEAMNGLVDLSTPLRPAGHRGVRSRSADLGAKGRQHRRGA